MTQINNITDLNDPYTYFRNNWIKIISETEKSSDSVAKYQELLSIPPDVYLECLKEAIYIINKT